MLDKLAELYDIGGPLVSVECALFEGNPNCVTAVLLRFDSVSTVFRAVADDDTLTITLGPLVPAMGERLLNVGSYPPWSRCIGLGVAWAWQLTNQQGYSDGVRLEFSEPGEEFRAVIELIVVASAIQIFAVLPAAMDQQWLAANTAITSPL